MTFSDYLKFDPSFFLCFYKQLYSSNTLNSYTSRISEVKKPLNLLLWKSNRFVSKKTFSHYWKSHFLNNTVFTSKNRCLLPRVHRTRAQVPQRGTWQNKVLQIGINKISSNTLGSKEQERIKKNTKNIPSIQNLRSRNFMSIQKSIYNQKIHPWKRWCLKKKLWMNFTQIKMLLISSKVFSIFHYSSSLFQNNLFPPFKGEKRLKGTKVKDKAYQKCWDRLAILNIKSSFFFKKENFEIQKLCSLFDCLFLQSQRMIFKSEQHEYPLPTRNFLRRGWDKGDYKALKEIWVLNYFYFKSWSLNLVILTFFPTFGSFNSIRTNTHDDLPLFFIRQLLKKMIFLFFSQSQSKRKRWQNQYSIFLRNERLTNLNFNEFLQVFKKGPQFLLKSSIFCNPISNEDYSIGLNRPKIIRKIQNEAEKVFICWPIKAFKKFRSPRFSFENNFYFQKQRIPSFGSRVTFDYPGLQASLATFSLLPPSGDKEDLRGNLVAVNLQTREAYLSQSLRLTKKQRSKLDFKANIFPRSDFLNILEFNLFKDDLKDQVLDLIIKSYFKKQIRNRFYKQKWWITTKIFVHNFLEFQKNFTYKIISIDLYEDRQQIFFVSEKRFFLNVYNLVFQKIFQSYYILHTGMKINLSTQKIPILNNGKYAQTLGHSFLKFKKTQFDFTYSSFELKDGFHFLGFYIRHSFKQIPISFYHRYLLECTKHLKSVLFNTKDILPIFIFSELLYLNDLLILNTKILNHSYLTKKIQNTKTYNFRRLFFVGNSYSGKTFINSLLFIYLYSLLFFPLLTVDYFLISLFNYEISHFKTAKFPKNTFFEDKSSLLLMPGQEGIKKYSLDRFKNSHFIINDSYRESFLQICPSSQNIRLHLKTIKAILKKSHRQNQELVIKKLSKQIKLWCFFNALACPKKVLTYCDFMTFQYLWRWACHRHPTKSKNWIKCKYFHTIGPQKWVFAVFSKKNKVFIILPLHSKTYFAYLFKNNIFGE